MQFLLILICFSCLNWAYAHQPDDLERYPFDCILETKKIEIHEVPHAFNPSFVKWQDLYLMCYRRVEITAPPLQKKYSSVELSFLEIVILDENFNVISERYPLPLDHPDRKRPVFIAEDGRLLVKDDRLYLIYNGTKEEDLTEEGFRVYIAELSYDPNKGFSILSNECLTDFEGKSKDKREKNWVPFVYDNELYLAYSLSPHKIFKPLLDGSGRCETLATTQPSVVWEWGELRGGTPAVQISKDEYLAFFHSSTDLVSVYSPDQPIPHYFMGAYLFSAHSPFEIRMISPEPIIGKDFYNGLTYEPYWHPVRVVFPGGILVENDDIWVAYGRQDHEVWVAKIQKKCLLESLINVSTVFE